MDISAYTRTAARWWWLVLIAAILGGAAAYSASSTITPTYRSTATMLVVHQEMPGVLQQSDVETSMMLASTFSHLITLPPFLERAVAEAGLGMSSAELSERLTVSNPTDSQIIEVTGTASDPPRAQAITNAVAEVFATSPEVRRVSGGDVVTIVSPAQQATTPVSPRPALNAMMGALLAAVAAGVLVVGFEYVRDRRDAAGERLAVRAPAARS
ncbi:MAG: Wzz/FepE/Etk N-terminal domain-containing protein [Dehalococcoidia bacterium]